MVKTIKALLIDDDPVFLDMIKEHMDRFTESNPPKIEINTLDDPSLVFDYLEECDYDIIISDYQMQTTSGIQLLKFLKDGKLRVPFIIITGHGSEDIASECLNLGADFYLKKGINHNEMIQKLHHFILKAVKLKETEQKLSTSEQKLRKIIYTANIGFAELDEKFHILDVNPYFCSILNRNPSELVGKALLNFMTKSSYKIYINHMKIREQGVGSSYEIVFKKPDNTYAHCLIKGMPLLDNAQNFVGSFDIVTDISELKKTETALKESEKQYKNTINSMGDPIFVVDSDTRIILINKVLKKWVVKLNLKRNVIGKKLHTAFPQVPEEDLEDYESLFQSNSEEVITKDAKLDFNGRGFYFHSRKIPIVEDGKVKQVVTVIRDVTAQKKAELSLITSERRFRNMAENINDGIAIIEEDEPVFINRRMEEITGYSNNELQYMKESDFCAPQEKERIQTFRKNYIAGTDTHVTIKFWIDRKNGSTRYIQNNYTFIDNEANQVPKIIYVGTTDLTEIKRQEEEIKKSKETLEAVINNLPGNIAIFWKNTEGIFMGCNKAFAESAGLESPEDIIGKTEYDLRWADNQANEFLATDKEIIKKDKPVYNLQVKSISPDGTMRTYITNKMPLHDLQGNVVGVLGTVKIDHTEEHPS